MTKHLYDCFSHWYRGGQIYVYSDPHFNDDEMVYIRKDYISDEAQVRRINSKIGKNDTLIILGDVGDIEFIKRIRGYKVLITGNHDKGESVYKGIFNEVYTGALTINDKVILSHEPLILPKCFYNIHGHDHSNKINANDGLHLNVCAENIDYAPISLNKLIKDGTFNNVPNIHRNAINKAIDKKIRENNFINYFDLLTYSNDLPSLVFDNGYECKCIGYISYRDTISPLP